MCREEAMVQRQYILELATGTLSVMRYYFPVTIVVGCFWICGLIETGRHLLERPLRLIHLCLLPGALTLAVLFVGVAFEHRGPVPLPGTQWALPNYLIGGLAIAHLPLAALLIWRSEKQWPVVAASSAFWLWATLCAAIIAGMSVTGDWL
jgi:hypothetical protein